MKNLLFQNIAKHVQLTSQEEAIIEQYCTQESYKAKTVLIKPGDEAHFTYFVLKGILRSYTVDDNGNAHILSFAVPGWWVTDMYSFLTQKKAIMYIDVMEDCDVFILHKSDIEILYEKVPKLERFFRILTENNLIANQQRVLDKMALTAEERYEKFSKKYPDIINCLPQKYIASYIGVTPEFFSKMKSKFLRKK
ncbi:Crp/Fnr family transcriptional regulator [Flavobacterium sp. xlx-214]|uniref:Crp/Fnr family transcriptional regulator n=1 Tax=unclassified Flavobacterium TaxID=196869 RepID=UPI0013D28695|nr:MULTISPECIES: Crp/Fnr family transcriptional regulator [unclassified Flavobacterium]MBA5792327.1 Crp/Fnr family transcriptional regulator [Flavobacterium sp. xlx-221]QMI82358.1 Crp/Fnr family transcriptional regulator [Flavobacterium sp. xlx-214]